MLDPRTLSIALDDLLPVERTVVVDSGAFMGWPSMYLRVPDAAGFVFPQAFQCVGLALGNAIGAAIARPDRLTVAALGDGGALLSLPEFETLGRLGLPMLVVIYDDAAYGAEVHHFAPMGEAVDLAQFPDTDFAALARAAGCHGLTARSLDDLAALRDVARRARRPFVLDAKVDPDDLRRLARGSVQTLTEEDNPCPCSPISSTPCSPAPPASSTSPSRCSERTPVLVLPEPFANTPGLTPPRAQPLRRPRPRLGVGRPGDRRARRHALRRADPLDHRPRRRGRRQRAARAARRPGRRHRQVRRGGAGPRLPADRRPGARLRGRARRRCPTGAWLLLRTGWDARAHDQDAFLNVSDGQPHTPGIDAECARWLAQESPVVGVGVETVGTDAGAAGGFDPPFPVHHFVLGAGKYGLTQLANLAELPPVGAVVDRGAAEARRAGPAARRGRSRWSAPELAGQEVVVGADGEDARQAPHAPALGALEPARALGEVEGQLAAEPERVGDQVAVVERDRRPQLVADLGEEDDAARRAALVELGEAGRAASASSGVAQRMVRRRPPPCGARSAPVAGSFVGPLRSLHHACADMPTWSAEAALAHIGQNGARWSRRALTVARR